MKTMLKTAIIIMVALGGYVYSSAQGLQSQKGGTMVIILGDKAPTNLEFNACNLVVNALKQVTILDEAGKTVFDQLTETDELTISTSSFSPGNYTVVVDTGECQEKLSVEL